MKDCVLDFGLRYSVALLLGTLGLLGLLAPATSGFAQDLQPLVFDTPEITLVGEDARAQLLVHTPTSTDGAVIDLTRNVRFEPSVPGLIAIDAAGLITPMATGALNLTAHADGYAPAIIPIRVELSGVEEPVNFPNQIVPIFTKFGCNGGGCHGKIAGQNGFRLSLLGSEPAEDYEHLVRESRGRRLFPAAADTSLLLTKSIGTVPHGGGQRMELDSHEYRVLRRWISQAMPYGDPNARKITSIVVSPSARQMARNTQQQLSVLANFSDGSSQDVTRTVQYESNNLDMADVSAAGLVSVRDFGGEVSIMARYQGQVTVFRASVPLGTLTQALPMAQGPIDVAVFDKLKALGIPASALCDDATFLRRVTLDIAGRLPSLEEVDAYRAAVANGGDSPEATQLRRIELVNRLLESADYASNFASKWSAILRNNRTGEDTRYGAYAFHDWLRQGFFENKPISQLVRELLTATGDAESNPAVIWYRQVNNTESRTEDIAQLFMGQRLQCARCHHHPYEKWAQQDYFQMAAFFSTVERREGALPSEPKFGSRVAAAAANHPKTGQALSAVGLDSAKVELANYEDPRGALAEWMTAPSNPFFAKSVANRYWKHFLGKGLVEPEDDMRITNPPSNPQLLDALAKQLVDSGYDLKHLIRSICTSTTYQLSSTANEWNIKDTNCYSRFYPKRLSAEILLDCIDTVSGSISQFDGLPVGTKAIELPDTSFASYFLTVFGRPDSSTACECERTNSSTLAQSLHLLNSKEMQGKLSSDASRAATWAGSAISDAALSPVENIRKTAPDRIRELYQRSLGRSPSESEQAIALEYLMQRADRLKEAYEDLVWGIVNSKEFLFNH
ncbi:MAG: DUF1553 domain-containing protein [Planctomycetota bacterium]|nr:DUF1553 domain-containing protein [Planctomycetota bacterium]